MHWAAKRKYYPEKLRKPEKLKQEKKGSNSPGELLPFYNFGSMFSLMYSFTTVFAYKSCGNLVPS